MRSFQYRLAPEYIGGFGRLSLAGYIRLFQRAATEHSDTLGYTSNWYRNNGTAWMARRHRISVENPVRPEESVIVETEVEDFKRIRSLRCYTIRVESTNTLAAEGYTEWVYLDRNSHKPNRIPEAMIGDFGPRYQDSSPNRIQFDSPEIPSRAYSRTFTVQFRDLDELGHVNNVSYTEYLVETLLTWLQDTDGSIESGLPDFPEVSHLTIQYLDQAGWQDSLQCLIDPVEDSASEVDFVFAIKSSEKRLVEGRGAWK
ncbi:MAG: thioesterase family protein [bacterium]